MPCSNKQLQVLSSVCGLVPPVRAGTPVPSLAALLDSQRDSTSPKVAGRPASAAKAAGAGGEAAAAGGGSPQGPAAGGVMPAGQAAMAGAAEDPGSGGKTRGSSGSGSRVAPAVPAGGAPTVPLEGQPLAAAADGLGAAAAARQHQEQHQEQRKRPASQDADRWQQKRSRFGKESQERQEQQQQSSGGPAGQGEPLTQGAPEQQQQQQLREGDGSEPQSSSGIGGLCTQPPAIGGSLQGAAPMAAPLRGLPGAASHAALHHLWQQQGTASPLPLLDTPGPLSAPAQRGADVPTGQPQAATAAARGGDSSPWLAGGGWQAPAVAGAAPGATPRFVAPTITPSGPAWQPASLPAASVLPPFLHLLSGPPRAAEAAPGADGSHGPRTEQERQHRLARASSPQ